MGRDKDRYEISAKRTLAIRKRRPWNVNLGICYVPSTSQTSQSDVFWTSMGLHCAIWELVSFLLRLNQMIKLVDGSTNPFGPLSLEGLMSVEMDRHLPFFHSMDPCLPFVQCFPLCLKIKVVPDRPVSPIHSYKVKYLGNTKF
jgi:hypothetical protein